MKSLLVLGITGVLLLYGCGSLPQKKTQVVGNGDEIGSILRSNGLKVTREPELSQFKKPYAFRFWYYHRYRHLCLTITCDDHNEMIAYFYEWHGQDKLFKSWKHKLNHQQTEQVFDFTESANLWNVNETAYVDSLVTDGTMYDIEIKKDNKYRELYANMTGNFDCDSTCKSLCQRMFLMAGAEI